MHIKVLQHHIDEGARRNGYFCAIALAVKEQVPGVQRVTVSNSVDIDNKLYSMPAEAKSFMACFDRECKDPDHVKPFEFDLTEW